MAYHNSLEDLGGNRGENPFIIVDPNVGIDVREGLLLGTKQDPQSDVNVLQVYNKINWYIMNVHTELGNTFNRTDLCSLLQRERVEGDYGC